MTSPAHHPFRRLTAVAALVTLLTGTALLAGCAVGDPSPDAGSKTVVVATHDSWAMSKKVLARFTARTGYRVKIVTNGDAGQLTNKLVLTKGSPIADAVFGIDNTFASRAVEQGILTDYSPPDEPASAARYRLGEAKADAQLTPIDYGDVCVNIDDRWFARHKVAAPRTLADLASPEYRGLFVTPAASTSSPGLAFLLTTIAAYGDRWPAYWQRLMGNDTKVTAGWSDAYEVDFTAGGGNGDRPIVLSYASSPPFTIPKGGSRPTTSSLLDTCFRQVEYAGVLAGAADSKGAQAFVDFMTQRTFQEALPDNMYVFPVDANAKLPATWARYAKVAPHPYSLPPREIATHRDAWLRRWSDLTSR